MTKAPMVDASRGTATPKTEAGGVVVKGRKKKRRYTKALKSVQKLERGISQVNRRLARAIESGIETWQGRRNKSSRKRRDGALRDWVPNSIRAASKMLRVASRAGNDFLDEVNPRFRLRRALRLLPGPWWF